MPETPPPDDLPRGAVQMITAAFFFGLMAIGVQIASEHLPSPMVVFFRNLIALGFVIPLAWRNGWQPMRTSRLSEHLLRATAGLASMYCSFFAFHHLRLADAVLLQYTLPLFMPIVEATWTKMPMPRRFWVPILVGFAGVLLVLKPGSGFFQGAALVGLSAGLLAAVAQAGIRRMTTSEPALRIIFYFSLFATLASSVPAALSWVSPGPLIGLLVLVGGAGTLAQFLMTRAYACAPAAQVGVFTYASIPFALLFDWIRTSRLPGLSSLLGALLIIGAGMLMMRFGRRQVDV